MKKRLAKTLETTKFAGSPIIAVAAKPDSPDEGAAESLGMKEMSELLTAKAYVPQRNNTGPFLFAVDHCFSVRGQGTVMTGTVLKGSVSVNDNVEIPSLKVVKKVKSMQMFRQPVSTVSQGDRAGICVTQFDPKLLERGLVCQPSSIPTIFAGIISVEKIQYYKGQVASKAKFHITVGHETVMGKAQFFGLPVSVDPSPNTEGFDFSQEYIFQEELHEVSKGKDKETAVNSEPLVNVEQQYAVLELEKPVTCPNSSLVIGSRLDTDIHLNTCRLAFHGKFLTTFTDKNYTETSLPELRIFKTKSRVGEVERAVDEYSLVGRGLFKKETNMALFSNLKVRLSTGEAGVIEGGFGQSGKFKVRIPAGLSPESFNLMSTGQRKKGKGKGVSAEEGGEKVASVKIILDFKRYIFDPEKKMIQT
jgi:selenocysteine-specific elongation factor